MKKRSNFGEAVSFAGRIVPNHLPAFLTLQVSIITAFLLCLSFVPAIATESNAMPFQIGDRVQTTNQAPVFDPPYQDVLLGISRPDQGSSPKVRCAPVMFGGGTFTSRTAPKVG